MARRQAYSPVSWPAATSAAQASTAACRASSRVGDGVDAALPDVPGDGLADVPVAQRLEGLALARVVLAAVLGQVVDGVGVARHQGTQRAARADRAELAVVADEHQLGPGQLDVGGQAGQVDVVGHAHLVQDDDGLFGEGQLAVVEPPDEAGQRAGLGDLGLVAEVAGRLAGGGGADHFVAGALEGVGHGPQHGGLAGPGHPHDQLGPAPRSADGDGGRPLLF